MVGGTIGVMAMAEAGPEGAVAFWLAFGTALSITAIVEIIRWVRDRGATAPSDPTGTVIAHPDDVDRTLDG